MEFTNASGLVESLLKSTQLSREPLEKYANYCLKTKANPKNHWFQKRSVEELDEVFRRIHKEGLLFDGENITFQSTGVSYNYVAYKNKMLLVYPDSKIDIQLVYEGDVFSFEKISGEVRYNHQLKNPFGNDDQNIIGGYVVIKNERGEFLTTLSRDQIDNHRKVARTDYIWKAWFPEMCMKTLIKKACKQHFQDDFKGIEEVDNENYDLDKPEKESTRGLGLQIIELLDKYEGDDKLFIRDLCKTKQEAGEFDQEFAERIIKDLTK